MNGVLALLLSLAASPSGITVDKATNPETPVPREAPRPYHLTPATQRAAERTRHTVEKRHDRAWAARERRAIHTERGAVLNSGP